MSNNKLQLDFAFHTLQDNLLILGSIDKILSSNQGRIAMCLLCPSKDKMSILCHKINDIAQKRNRYSCFVDTAVLSSKSWGDNIDNIVHMLIKNNGLLIIDDLEEVLKNQMLHKGDDFERFLKHMLDEVQNNSISLIYTSHTDKFSVQMLDLSSRLATVPREHII